MASLPKREKTQTVKVTVKSVSIDTLNDRFHFTISEPNVICQTNKEGTDEFVTSFSEGFSCLLEDLKKEPHIQDIYLECMNNPNACNGVDKALFIVLQGLLDKEVTLSRHFAHAGDTVRRFAMQKDSWVTDSIAIDFAITLSERLEKKFDSAIEKIERDDDF